MRNIYSPYLNHKQIFKFVETIDEHIESWLVSLLSLNWQNHFLEFLSENKIPLPPEAIVSFKHNFNLLDKKNYPALVWSVMNLNTKSDLGKRISLCYQESQRETIKKILLEAILKGISSFDSACKQTWQDMIRRDSLFSYLQDMRCHLVVSCAREYFEKESVAEFLQMQELDRYSITAQAIGFAVPSSTLAKPPSELYAKHLEKYFRKHYSPIAMMMYIEGRILNELNHQGYFGYNEIGYASNVVTAWMQYLMNFFKKKIAEVDCFLKSDAFDDILDVDWIKIRQLIFVQLRDEGIINQRLSYQSLVKSICHVNEVSYCIKTACKDSVAALTNEALQYAFLYCSKEISQLLSWNVRSSIISDAPEKEVHVIHKYFDELILELLDNESLNAESQHDFLLQSGYLHGVVTNSEVNHRMSKYIDLQFVERVFNPNQTILPMLCDVIRVIFESSNENKALFLNYVKNIKTSAEYVEALQKGPHYYALLLELLFDILDIEHCSILFEREVIRSVFGERDNLFFHTIQFYPHLVKNLITQFKKFPVEIQCKLMREYASKMKNMISVTIWSCPDQLGCIMDYLYGLDHEDLIDELYDQSVLNSALRISVDGACTLLTYMRRHDHNFVEKRLANAYELIRERLQEGDLKSKAFLTSKLLSAFRVIDPECTLQSLVSHYQVYPTAVVDNHNSNITNKFSNDSHRKKNLYDVVLYEIRGQLHAKKKLSYADPQFVKIRKKLVKLLHEADGAKGTPEDVVGYIDEILKSTSVKSQINDLTLIEAFISEPVEAHMLTAQIEPNLLFGILLHNPELFVPLLNKISSPLLIFRLFTQRNMSGQHLLSLVFLAKSSLFILPAIFAKLERLAAQQLLDIIYARGLADDLLIVSALNQHAASNSETADLLLLLLNFMLKNNLSIPFEILALQKQQGLNSLTLGLLYKNNLAEMIVDYIDKHSLTSEQWFALCSQACFVKQSHLNGANAVMLMIMRAPHLVMRIMRQLQDLPLGLTIYLFYQRNDELDNLLILALKYAPELAETLISLILQLLTPEQYTKLFTTVNLHGFNALSICAKQDTILFFKLIDSIKPEIEFERKKQLFAEVLLSDTQHTQKSIDAIVHRLPNTRADIVQILLSQEPNLLFLAMSSNPSLIAPMKDYMLVLSTDKSFAKYIPDFMISPGLGFNVLLESVKYAPDCVADLVELLAKVPTEKLLTILSAVDEHGMSIFIYAVADGQEANFKRLLKLLDRLSPEAKSALIESLYNQVPNNCFEKILRLPMHRVLYLAYQQATKKEDL